MGPHAPLRLGRAIAIEDLEAEAERACQIHGAGEPVGGIAMEIGILVTEFILAIPLLLVGFLGWLLLHHLGPAGHILMATGVVVLVLAFAAILVYVTIGFIGAVVLFFQAYALYFLAGRYPMLGDQLDPPTPGFAYSTPPPPAPATPQLPFLSPDPERPTA